MPPNDPRVLSMPIDEMKKWIIQDRIDSFISENSVNIEELTFDEVYPRAPGTFNYIKEQVLKEMGGTEKALFSEVEAESVKRFNEEMDKVEKQWSKE